MVVAEARIFIHKYISLCLILSEEGRTARLAALSATSSPLELDLKVVLLLNQTHPKNPIEFQDIQRFFYGLCLLFCPEDWLLRPDNLLL